MGASGGPVVGAEGVVDEAFLRERVLGAIGHDVREDIREFKKVLVVHLVFTR